MFPRLTRQICTNKIPRHAEIATERAPQEVSSEIGLSGTRLTAILPELFQQCYNSVDIIFPTTMLPQAWLRGARPRHHFRACEIILTWSRAPAVAHRLWYKFSHTEEGRRRGCTTRRRGFGSVAERGGVFLLCQHRPSCRTAFLVRAAAEAGNGPAPVWRHTTTTTTPPSAAPLINKSLPRFMFKGISWLEYCPFTKIMIWGKMINVFNPGSNAYTSQTWK